METLAGLVEAGELSSAIKRLDSALSRSAGVTAARSAATRAARFVGDDAPWTSYFCRQAEVFRRHVSISMAVPELADAAAPSRW